MYKTKLRSFLNNQVYPFETLKTKLSLSLILDSLFISHTHISNQYKKLLKNYRCLNYTKYTLNISGV